MHRYIFMGILLMAFYCLNMVSNVLYANKDEATYGTLLVKEYKNNELKSSGNVTFTIADMFARVNISEKVYYLVNLDDEKTYVVNTKREKATLTYASNVLKHRLPPLIILRSRASLRKYLTSINAHLLDEKSESTDKFEVWQFNIDKYDYIVKVKLPEFFPKQVIITFDKRKTVINVEERKIMSVSYLEPDYFMVPEEYKIIDLIPKK